uniref:Vomeronasal type-1 receptor n=1 Tax=Ornithorhynchus anatinus TaxID=9258 RepID=F7DGI9_ORNAN
MVLSDLILGMLFLSQTGVGVLGNTMLLTVYVNIFISQPHQKKPTDLILLHLTVANTVILLTRGMPETLVAFGINNIVDDVGCQVLMYINRVARGLSICTTCLLSVFQAITISLSTSPLAKFKLRAPSYILPSFFFFWIFNLLIYIEVAASTRATKNVTIKKYTYIFKYCSLLPRDNYISAAVSLTATTFRDLFFVFLMSWASGYMVTVLYRHRKQVQHIHSSNLSPKSSLEIRAIQTILLLVSFFICFYWINCCITLYLSLMKEVNGQLQNASSFLSACYSSLCPFVLIKRDPRAMRTQCGLLSLFPKGQEGLWR